MARFSNPIAFTRWPVTVFTTLVYLAVGITLLVIQTGVPAPPSSPTPIHGVNLTEAWLDLQLLTSAYHPYNSRQNQVVHDWLLTRVESILEQNAASYDPSLASPAAYVFDDTSSNLTFSSAGIPPAPGVSVYFEGTNIIVYVPGSEDDPSEWWSTPGGKPISSRAVLVNAHFDSVSTAYGATDDGVGAICVLQLLKYFTTKGNKPKNGVILLLNNGEEDFLNGATAFSQHPMSKVIGTFLNLEGAGAGGRAALFRSTDEEVTRAYAHAPYPFGTAASADGFNRGLVRSQTDYVIFNGKLGYRGLDVAFIGPRARYHTNQDDARHTSVASLWHMLSGAIATTKALTSASIPASPNTEHNPRRSSLWFDVLGRRFAMLRAHTFFALSVTLLVAGPIFHFLTLVLLYRSDKLYLWSGARNYHLMHGEDSVTLYGWRGFFRFPVILLVSCAAPVALAYLLFKENQFIAHSSEWAVWSMMIAAFVFIAWFFCRAADFGRPSSLTRAYGFSWLWLGWWAFLVAATVFEEHFHLLGVYPVLIYAASVWLATWLSYLELFSLPKKSTYCRGKVGSDYASSRSRSVSRTRGPGSATQPEDSGATGYEEEEPTERSSLLRSGGRSSFKNYPHTEEPESPKQDAPANEDVREEQEWSKTQWTFTWFLQLIVLVPVNLIVVGQLGLFLTESLHQTGQDGSSMFLVYISIAIITILLFSPIVPLVHRFTWHIPMFLLLVLIGTMIYNLLAFPFSPNNRVKLFFLQQIDLDNGNNTVHLMGVPPYTRTAIGDIPSSAGQHLSCVKSGLDNNLERCGWTGLTPKVAEGPTKSWLTFNATRLNASEGENRVQFTVSGKDTRACKLVFDNTTISSLHVDGQAPPDKRFEPVPKQGSSEIRLWSRTSDRTWTVDVGWLSDEDAESGAANLKGRVVCEWSDANQRDVIPAFDEALRFVPDWVAITKAADGLVEGYKLFDV